MFQTQRITEVEISAEQPILVSGSVNIPIFIADPTGGPKIKIWVDFTRGKYIHDSSVALIGPKTCRRVEDAIKGWLAEAMKGETVGNWLDVQIAYVKVKPVGRAFHSEGNSLEA